LSSNCHAIENLICRDQQPHPVTRFQHISSF
jgi:hypothetical protein